MKEYRKLFENKFIRISILIGIILLCFLISRIPYLNLLSVNIAVFPVLIVLLSLFKPTEKIIVIVASVITGIAVIASILSLNEVLEIYGNTIFILLFYILVLNINLLKKKADK